MEGGNVLIFWELPATFEGQRRVVIPVRTLASLEMISRMVLPHLLARVWTVVSMGSVILARVEEERVVVVLFMT
tara:strand:- start:142 stop:363 length:222 start_codon:yes stop_codon:yes gene_type:complete